MTLYVILAIVAISGVLDILVGSCMLLVGAVGLLASWQGRGALLAIAGGIALAVVYFQVPSATAPAAAVSLDPAPETSPTSGCGGATAATLIPDFSDYRCESRRSAGARWSRCLRRPAYSAVQGDGCPGRDRCCPPR